jgi:hypothetical protein
LLVAPSEVQELVDPAGSFQKTNRSSEELGADGLQRKYDRKSSSIIGGT